MKPDTERDPLELLADEYVQRCRDGERPSVDEYCDRAPELAVEIRELFPTIAAMETLKESKQHSSGPAQMGPKGLERLGDFRIVGEIGRGGMGIVYSAEQLSLGRRVAVKVLPKQALLNPKQLKRFEREAQTAARLHHTNIVPVFGVGEQDGFHYIVMQQIDGVGLDEVCGRLRTNEWDPSLTPSSRATLASRAAKALLSEEFERVVADGSAVLSDVISSSPVAPTPTSANVHGDETVEYNAANLETREFGFDVADEIESVDEAQRKLGSHYWRSVARIGVQVAEALQYAHSQETLHRDIKPGNLLLDRHGVVWVADFGLAKAMEQDGISHTGDIVGTLAYMAPEQLRGESTAKSDIYSLGLSLYEMLALRPAFHSHNRSDLIRQVTQTDPERPSKINPDVPRDLETIVLKAISREPHHRYATAGDLAEDLERFLTDRPILARRATQIEKTVRWCRRNPAVASLTAIAFASLIMVAVVSTYSAVRTGRALKNESAEREKAIATLTISLRALERVYLRYIPDRLTQPQQVTMSGADGEEVEILTQSS
ncbi:MAG: serine/threonine-protein kinase, partial [Pirellulaceae bacterium]|nr:serine/threonine-protein kinase [Pirellulaceae bacterium]